VPLSAGDEIDRNLQGGGNELQTGVNTLSFWLWGCQSSACNNAYGQTWIGIDGPGSPTSEASIVTAVAMPDETSFLSLVLAAFAAGGLGWRRRRKGSIALPARRNDPRIVPQVGL